MGGSAHCTHKRLIEELRLSLGKVGKPFSLVLRTTSPTIPSKHKMITNNLKVATTTNGDSPKACKHQRYVLLHSPKAGLLSRSMLPFVILFFGAGVLLGGTWTKLGLRMTPATWPTSKHSTAGASGKANINETTTTFQSANVLPIAWLMSFPVSWSSFLA